MLTIERFTAWCPCPSCDYVDCHRFREPKPQPLIPMSGSGGGAGAIYVIEQVEKMQRDLEFSIRLQANMSGVKVPKVAPRLPADESNFEVIRICQCGYQWGQA